jgi:hypothetical protein
MFGRGPGVPCAALLLALLLRIRDRSGTLGLRRPTPAQVEYTRRRSERNIILKARQMGITTFIAERAFVNTILRPGTVTLQVAHTQESAQQIFRIVHRLAGQFNQRLLGTLELAHANVRELAFAAVDSRYIVDTAGNRHAGRGLTVHNLHASEVALWPGDPRETMAGLLAAVAPGGSVDIESTPHGVGGYFHSEWLRARRGEGFTPHFFPWWIEPAYRAPLLAGESLAPYSAEERRLIESAGLTEEQIKFRRRLRAQFGDLAPQEYAESDAECFLVSGRPVFDPVTIEERLRRLPMAEQTAHNGAESVWYQPEPGRRYIIGADVAEGKERGDYSAAVVLDARSGMQCAEVLARWPLQRFAEELNRLGRRYNGALLAVERNNHGHTVLHILETQFRYPHLFRQPASGHEKGGQSSSPPQAGFLMNAATRPQTVEALRDMLRDAPESFSSQRLLEQLRAFSYDDSGRAAAPPGVHDDLVIAAGIACAVRATSPEPRLLSVAL